MGCQIEAVSASRSEEPDSPAGLGRKPVLGVHLTLFWDGQI